MRYVHNSHDKIKYFKTGARYLGTRELLARIWARQRGLIGSLPFLGKIEPR